MNEIDHYPEEGNHPYEAKNGHGSIIFQRTGKKLRRSRRTTFAIRYKDYKKEYSYSRLISFFRLSDWAKKFCITSSALFPPQRGQETFVDAAGTKRYVDTWQPIEDKLSMSTNWEDFFLQTGCMKMSHLYEIYESMREEADGREESMTRKEDQKRKDDNDESNRTENDDRNIPSHLKEYCYINEWQRLWIYLENDERDELAEYAPLFRILIEFMFHPRVQTLMLISTIYNILVLTVSISVYPGAIDSLEAIFNFITCILQLATYSAIVIVYRGALTPTSTTFPFQKTQSQKNVMQDEREESAKHKKEEISLVAENRVDILAFSLSTNAKNHFSFIRKELFARLRQEVYLLFCMSSSKSSSEPGTICCGCRESSQMMKWRQYQQKRSEMIRRHQQKRKLSYHELLNISLKFLIRVNGINPNHINFDRWSYRMVLVLIVLGFPMYLFFYVYLAYVISSLNQHCHGTFNFNSQFCSYFTLEFLLSGCLLSKFIPQVIFGISVMTGLVALAYGAEVAYRMVNSFLLKFRTLRRVETFDMETIFSPAFHHQGQSIEDENALELKESPSTTQSALHAQDRSDQKDQKEAVKDMNVEVELLGDDDVSQNPLYNWVKRDAIEHYFFICEVFSASDKIWSPALLGIFSLGIIIAVLYGAFFSGGDAKSIRVLTLSQLIIYVVVRFLILFVYPIASLCHANAYIYELTAFFSKSSTDDFQLIGGCQQWVNFTTSCPAAWTFMGLWITWDRLFGLLWTFFAAGLASAIAAIFAIF